MQITIVALGFLGMGLTGLIRPSYVVGIFGLKPDTPDARNEVRAVYGGFGVAIAALLWSTFAIPDIRGGVIISVAVALAGMATGRLIATVIERPSGVPVIVFLVEVAAAGLLVTAY